MTENGKISEKRIEEQAFWKSNKQKNEEILAMNRCKSVLKDHQRNLNDIWKKNLNNLPKKESPGPCEYKDVLNYKGMSMEKNNSSSYSFGK